MEGQGMKYLAIILFCIPTFAFGWKNGQDGNASTNDPSECSSPPYSTHDWIADRALALLPEEERSWLEPYKTLYLLGTESADNKHIPNECGTPHSGYDDRRKGHSVEWDSSFSNFLIVDGNRKDRAALRAQEEYSKAVIAYERGNLDHAAFYLGAMAHYIGDVTQYGHSYPNEVHHSDYEGWVGRRTKEFSPNEFDSYISLDNLTRRRPYTAVKRISKLTAKGDGMVLSAVEMDSLYSQKNTHQGYKDSIGHSLNYGVNELADVLHTFYLNIVE
jgi:zinc dependent phospholipase C